MQNSFTGILSLIVVIGLLVGAAYYFTTKQQDDSYDPIVQNPNGSDFSDDIDAERSITARHQFQDGTHTLTGEIELPTPCHELSYTVAVRESFPEQVSIDFTSSAPADAVCAQVITPKPFEVVFEASEEALITATMNGETAILNLIRGGSAEGSNGLGNFPQ